MLEGVASGVGGGGQREESGNGAHQVPYKCRMQHKKKPALAEVCSRQEHVCGGGSSPYKTMYSVYLLYTCQHTGLAPEKYGRSVL